MTRYFPVVIERESNGTVSAWVAGLPGVYAAADTVAAVKRGIRSALAAHVDALESLDQDAKSDATVVVLRREVRKARGASFRFVSVGALLARGTSPAKQAASRANGRKGGRPRGATRRSAAG